jgi:hypothetical protein
MYKLVLLIALVGTLLSQSFVNRQTQQKPDQRVHQQEQADSRQRLAKLVAAWRMTDRLDVKAHVNQIITQLDVPDRKQDDGKNLVLSHDLELHLARPLLGWGKLAVGSDSFVGKTKLIENEMIADGKSVYVLHSGKGERVARSFAGAFGEVVPILAWSAPGLTIKPKTVETLKDPEHPLLQGLRLTFHDRVEVLWSNTEGQPVKSTVKKRASRSPKETIHGLGEYVTETTYTFEQFDTATGGDLSPYQRDLPADIGFYDRLSPPLPGLLEIGTDAPAVDIRDLSGVEIPLRSLLGKTVLLHFWFFG